MNAFNRAFSGVFLAVAVLSTGVVQAQSNSSSASSSASGSTNPSWYAHSGGYIGFNAGRSLYSLSSGAGGFPAESRDSIYSIYGGSYFSDNFGLELGYTDFGRIHRAGGTTKAHGLNLSLVGRLPLAESFQLTGRLGSTYGRTEVTASSTSGFSNGTKSGFGLSYGVGVSYDFSTNWSAVLQWDRYKLDFASTGRDPVSSTTVGLKYRF